MLNEEDIYQSVFKRKMPRARSYFLDGRECAFFCSLTPIEMRCGPYIFLVVGFFLSLRNH